MLSKPCIHAPNAVDVVSDLLESFLHDRIADGVEFSADELIQFSWVWLRVDEDGGGLKITAPQFHVMPMEFVDDCSDCLNLVAQQRYLVDSFSTPIAACHCRQSAIVVRDLHSCKQWFMNRTDEAANQVSGWFIGAADSRLDPDDPSSFELVSLWEVFCRRPATGMFFLLPPGWQVVLEDRPVVLRDFEPVEPLDGSFFARTMHG